MTSPHDAQNIVTLGCQDVASEPYAARIDLTGDTDPHATMQAFLDDHIVYECQTLALFVDRAHATLADSLTERIAEHYRCARINQNTIVQTAERAARHFVHTLVRMAAGKAPSALSTLPIMRGHTAVVVGAGASLDSDVAALQRHRGPVIAVNTSVGALVRAGVTPSCVLVSEGKAIAEGLILNECDAPLVLDACANPRNWPDRPAAVTISTEPNLLEYALALRIAPIANGPSCVTQAAALAFALGADRVVLVGADCAFTGDPLRMYAAGTPYDQTTVTVDPQARRVVTEGPHKPMLEADLLYRPRIGGGTVPTTHVLDGFARWYASLPPNIRRRVVNASGDGQRLPGIDHRPIADVITTTAPAYAYSHPAQSLNHVATTQLDILRWQLSSILLARDDSTTLQAARAVALFGNYEAAEHLRARMERTLMTPKERRGRFANLARRAATEMLADAEGTVPAQ